LSRQRISLGKKGEDIAADFLKTRGFQIISRNYRQKSGEIDIICLDRGVFVFVEVKTRTSGAFGHPVEAVDRRKQHQISVTALDYLSRHDLLDEPARFDVVGVVVGSSAPDITHIVNAFEPC
jgi:putative endonuclease